MTISANQLLSLIDRFSETVEETVKTAKEKEHDF